MTIRRYCLCGASLAVRSHPSNTAHDLAAQFTIQHQGDGHGPATAAQASRARAREEAAALAEDAAW